MSNDVSLSLMDPAVMGRTGPEFRSKTVAILAAAALAASFVVVAISPRFNWFSILPQDRVEKASRAYSITGQGNIAATETRFINASGFTRVRTVDRTGAMTETAGPHGGLITIAGWTLAAVSASAVLLLLVRMPTVRTLVLVRIVLNTAMIGAIGLIAYHIHWLWKIKEVTPIVVAPKSVWAGALVQPGLGLYLGGGAAFLAAVCVMLTAWAMLEHPQRSMRIGEIGGFIAGGLTLLLVTPWDSLALWEAMQEAEKSMFAI